MLGFNPDTFAQETVTTVPAMDGSNTINICVEGTVTVSIENSVLGTNYAIFNGTSNIQTISGDGGTVQFAPLTLFSSAGSYSIGVLNGGTLTYIENFTVDVAPDPIAPVLTLSQTEGNVDAGPVLSATLDVAGSGGVGTMVNAYEYSVDDGLNWSTYNLGDNISTTQYKIPSVQIKASRYDTDGLGCSAENVYTWNIISRVHDGTGTQQGSYYSIQQAINSTTVEPDDELEVDAGTFTENLEIDVANLTLTSTTKHAAIIQTQSGFNGGSGYGGITFLADGCTLDGFKIEQNVGQAVIHTHDKNNATIKNNWIVGLAGAAPRGIDVGYGSANSDGIDIQENIFEDVYCGVYVNQATDLSIDGNEFKADMGDGCIYFDGTWNDDGISVTNNTATNANYLMYFYLSSPGDVTYSNNTLSNTELSNWTVVNTTDNIFYPDIQTAIDATETAGGEEIQVWAGTYTGHFDITKNLTLKGAQFGVDARMRSGAEALIQGTFEIASGLTDVTIDGFSFVANSGANELGIGGPYHAAVF